MSKELLEALGNFEWSDAESKKWHLHYDPASNGSITSVGGEGQTESSDPFIEVDEVVGKEFIEGKRYLRSYHVVNGVLELKSIDKNIYEASDKRLNQISEETEITPGVYFITVKGDADLVIDTISINEQNLEAETQRIKEYLENNDCYKDK